MPVVSKIQIANMALSHIGAKDIIESFEDRSVEARVCKVWYEHARVHTLEAHDWDFARKRLQLAEDGDEPPLEWAFRYQYPADCIFTRYLEQPNFLSVDTLFNYTIYPRPDTVPFSIEMTNDGQRKTILTDLEDAILVYTFDQEDTSSFSQHFVTALSYKLASDICYKITGKPQMKDALYKMFVYTLREARANDASQKVDKKPRDAEWIRGR